MATPTYEPIQSYTLGSPQTSVSFNSFAGYTDLVLVISGTATVNSDTILQINGATTNYSQTMLLGNGTSASSNRFPNGSLPNPTGIYLDSVTTGTGQFQYIVNIMNYANTTTFKTVLCRFGAAATGTEAVVGLYRSTSAITSLTLLSNFATNTTLTLYGIANADTGAKATGGIITYDNTYYYHTFGASGTFTPQQSLTADILVVAGGGGGAKENGTGGGGAGGLLGFASQSLSATGYTVTVGAGGAGATVNSTNGGTGGDSQFGSLTLVKGGGYSNSGNGGSGGGAYPGSVGGSATSGQGNAGGNGIIPFASPYPSGGGGGAGAAGANGVGSQSGNGGIGLSTYNSWSQVTGIGQNVSGIYYLAGGGGGGTTSQGALAGAGGYGGGAAGGANNGLANTGGGGGGGLGGFTSNGGSGGSGVVIIRYLKA